MQMRKLLALLGCATLAVPAAAQAKGVSQARVDGDGLDKSGIVFRGHGGSDSSAGSGLGRVVSGAGFYQAAFGEPPNAMEPGRPKGDLGPRYTITYTIPGPNNEAYEVIQDLYPYAAGGPVTYTPPGQRFFRTETRGGWFRGYDDLRQVLVDAGLPATPSAEGSRSGYAVSWPAAGLSLIVVGLLGTALVALRRRPGPLATR